MVKRTYMLDTCICSFNYEERSLGLLQKLQNKVSKQNRIVISAITYVEIRYGAIGRKVSSKHIVLVDDFPHRLDDFTLGWMLQQE